MNAVENIFPNRRLKLYVLSVLIGGVIIIVSLVAFPNKPPIPGPIKAKLTSTLLVPKGSDYPTNRDSVKYNDSIKLLTFRTQIKGGTAVTISEQPTPDQFTDIPTYADKVFEQFGEYTTFETAIGKVHLVRSPKDKKQAAVINAKGTLMFVKPDAEMSEDKWRQFFKSVVVVQ